MTRNEINTILDEYTDIDTPIEEEQEQEDVTMFEIIPFSQCEETEYHVDDEPYYGDIGLVNGWMYEARNVSDKRFPVGKILYFSVTFEYGMPDARADFWNFYARNLGWELTGRVVFRGYYEDHYDFEERDYYYTDAPKELIERARKGWQ